MKGQHSQLRLQVVSANLSELKEMCDTKQESVKEFYGKLKAEEFSDSLNETLKACNRPKNALPKKVREALKNVHDEVQKRYFGCGLCIPPALEGCTVLDLGCGAGRVNFENKE